MHWDIKKDAVKAIDELKGILDAAKPMDVKDEPKKDDKKKETKKVE